MTPGLFLELKRFDSPVVIFLVAERRFAKLLITAESMTYNGSRGT